MGKNRQLGQHFIAGQTGFVGVGKRGGGFKARVELLHLRFHPPQYRLVGLAGTGLQAHIGEVGADLAQYFN